MGTKVEPREEELYRRIDEVIHYVWDPIGISGMPMARDEYYSYLPKIFSMLQSGASADDITAHLEWIAVDRMGLQSNPKASSEVVSILQDWKETLDAQYA